MTWPSYRIGDTVITIDGEVIRYPDEWPHLNYTEILRDSSITPAAFVSLITSDPWIYYTAPWSGEQCSGSCDGYDDPSRGHVCTWPHGECGDEDLS